MSVYTQKYVSLAWWYGFIHALNSSEGFFLFPWSSSFSCMFLGSSPPLPSPTPFSTTTPNSCSLLCSLVPTCKGTATSSGKVSVYLRLFLSISLSPFAFQCNTTLIEATASEYFRCIRSCAPSIEERGGGGGERNREESFNFFRGSPWPDVRFVTRSTWKIVHRRGTAGGNEQREKICVLTLRTDE